MIRTVERLIKAHQARVGERARGIQHDVLGMAPSRLSEVTTGNLLRLPSEVTTLTLQNVGGQLLILDGYSQAGGPDVAP